MNGKYVVVFDDSSNRVDEDSTDSMEAGVRVHALEYQLAGFPFEAHMIKNCPNNEVFNHDTGFDKSSSVVGNKIPLIELLDDLFEKSLDPWRFSLIGRLNLQKIKFVDAVVILRSQWKLVGECKRIPLRRVFFTIKLDNEIDRDCIKSKVWEVTDQVLKVRNWVYNFRPTNQRTSRAFVWVRFPGLGLEFWSEQILFKICKEIGNPVKIDAATTKCDVGYYANVLVEVDFSLPIPNKVWIGTKYGGFFQEVSIPDFPKYCSTCKMVGHFIRECRVEKNKVNPTTSAGNQSECNSEDSIVHTIHVTPTIKNINTETITEKGRFSPLKCV
ncbi:uncharacterized protein LOC113305546 [Papaver somniferum]|uniref:uncharacterized protein LOC113305546 n=1 Tax=Papaver somniferum TaxID=3469 RepID=UPI000E6FB4D6|nr:uncharacterized protein LOC113305546 [Papaver somniferum]